MRLSCSRRDVGPDRSADADRSGPRVGRPSPHARRHGVQVPDKLPSAETARRADGRLTVYRAVNMPVTAAAPSRGYLSWPARKRGSRSGSRPRTPAAPPARPGPPPDPTGAWSPPTHRCTGSAPPEPASTSPGPGHSSDGSSGPSPRRGSRPNPGRWRTGDAAPLSSRSRRLAGSVIPSTRYSEGFGVSEP